MTQPTSKEFLEHAVRNTTQYTEGWRNICQELLDARARVAGLEAFARNVRDNFDHDEDAHRYNTDCRVCEAEKALRGTDSVSTPPEEPQRMFPVLYGHTRAEDEMRRIGPKEVPWSLLASHERQARRNHSQSLERLAERGGLGLCEMLAVIEERPYRRMDQREALEQIQALVAQHATPTGSEPSVGGEVRTCPRTYQVPPMRALWPCERQEGHEGDCGPLGPDNEPSATGSAPCTCERAREELIALHEKLGNMTDGLRSELRDHHRGWCPAAKSP